MKDYLEYLKKCFKKGNHILPLLMIVTIIIYSIFYILGLIYDNIIFGICAFASLVLGAIISISWSTYQYDKNKKKY